MHVYAPFFDRLVAAGLAYPAFDTPEELAAMRDRAAAEKTTFRYVMPEGYDLAAAVERAKAEPHVLRLRVPSDPIRVVDAVMGEIEFTSEHFDDFVIRKRDGLPTYHFAVVVDDELMGVTHVLRGQEHLNNTPKHVALMRMLTHEDGRGFRVPEFAHVPLITNADGSKMSKRDKDKAVKKAVRAEKLDAGGLASRCSLDEPTLARWLKDKSAQLESGAILELAASLDLDLPEVDVEDFRRAGYLPEVLCNFLALLGWSTGEKDAEGADVDRFDLAYLAERFDPSRIGKSPAKFDREKLLAFNADTIQHGMSDDAFESAWRDWCERYDASLIEDFGDRWELASRAARPRAKTLRDAADPLRFARIDDDAVEFDPKAAKKALDKGEPTGRTTLGAYEQDVLAGWTGAFEPGEIEARTAAFCESRGVGLGKIAGPLRVAITGTGVSPGLGETLALVGLEGVRVRVARCLEQSANG